ncbi:MAG TPA: amidohydrolase [Gammaproteobacteria bacterium]|nr:amidohydrolase [Gammaproteobacteria bacterium]
MYRARTFFIRTLMVWAALLPGLQAAQSPREWAQAHLDELLSYYRAFHSQPELSFREVETAERLAAAWEKCGYQVTTGVGGNGVVGLLRNGSGPVVMLRADMDALPVAEQTGLPYASTAHTVNEGGGEVRVMHACGHDVHMVNLIGVACYLAANRSRWKGTVMLVGQPAEEKGAGARAMLDDGLFERFPKPDYAIGLHVSPVLATGRIGYRPGFTMANVDSVDITLYGKGGHGAYPHTTVDPVVQAAQLVLSLQTIVSREVDPVAPAVVTIGSMHAGTKNNVISDTATLHLTVRTFSAEIREQVLAAIERKAMAVAAGADAPEPLVTIAKGTPSLYNDPALSARLRPVFRRALGDEHVEVMQPTMGGEDFSQYGRAGVPILMYWLGGVSPRRLEAWAAAGEKPPSLHSPLFYTDADATLVTGITSMASAVLELLKP